MKFKRRPNADILVVAAGHARSGSTWLYNSIRISYLSAGYATYGSWIGKYDPQIKADVHVVKAHDFDYELCRHADFVMTNTRDMRDVASSILRKGWVGETPQEVETTLTNVITQQILPWKEHSDLEVRYEEMCQDKPEAIARIVKVLGLDGVDPMVINMQVENLSRAVYPDIDPTSLLHPKHITDGRIGSFKETLSTEQLAAVEKVMERYDYLLSPRPSPDTAGAPQERSAEHVGPWRKMFDNFFPSPDGAGVFQAISERLQKTTL